MVVFFPYLLYLRGSGNQM